VSSIDGKIVNIEGDPRSPHNEGTLCPKGGRSFSSTSIRIVRLKFCTARRGRPTGRFGTSTARWPGLPELLKKTRDDTFIEKLSNGKIVNMTPAIFALGGATLEIEFNQICQKLMRGLGIVAIENQARI